MLTRLTAKDPNNEELLKSVARSLNLLLRLKVSEMQGDRTQNEMILFLHSLGCRPVEIADVLGKSSNDVNPVISRSRKASKAARPPKKTK